MKRKFLLLVVVMLMAFCLPRQAQADVAPPLNPPGANPEAGLEGTQVRMLAETVILEVQPGASVNDLGQAKVTADFTMRNLGSETETMAVRFPLSVNDGFGRFPEIRNLQVRLNGRTVSTRRVIQLDPLYAYEDVPWAEFDVTFPSGQDVLIQVTYTVDGSGEIPFVFYKYIFHTGAGWKDTIGSADLIVRLPYEASAQNVILDEHIGISETKPGGVLSGNEIRWHFENLEPTIENDFEISLVAPSIWRAVLRERQNVENNPNDGEAWGRLGKLYKQIFFLRRGFRHDAGGWEIYRASIEAYEKAIALLPEDALWHAGFADLLAIYAYYENMEGGDATAEALRSMQEINLALTLAPNDPKVQEIAEKIYYFFPTAINQLESGYDFLWLTATPLPPSPTPVPAAEPTATPEATSTVTNADVVIATPEAAPTPTATPPAGSIPLCASAMLIPLALLWLARRTT